MAAFFTFDINPSTTVKFTAPYPDPADASATLVITAPDTVEITINDLAALADFDPSDPGAVIDFTITELNASPDVVLEKGTDTLTELPWALFPPGKYNVVYTSASDSLNKDFLLFTTIDDCLYTKIDGYMFKTCCDSCNGSEMKRLVEKLLAVKEGAKLDFKYAAWADLSDKLTALEHLCEGDFCNCDCDC
jgi:hypothetical protein